jgi:hypothetical protein
MVSGPERQSLHSTPLVTRERTQACDLGLDPHGSGDADATPTKAAYAESIVVDDGFGSERHSAVAAARE